MTQPFYFAWVDANTAFNSSVHNVFDEQIISFDVAHEEGQFPVCDLLIKNPRIGLLNPSRKVWGWLSWDNNGTIEPLFYGVLVGIPNNMFGETIRLKLIAQPTSYIEDRQAVAEGMKIRPYYDPVWIDEKHRDNPDSILEGWSSLWHIDRLTLETTASDILDGEDGLVTFSESEVLYQSVDVTLGQPPLQMVEVKATVNWTQRQTGYVQMPQVNFVSYTGGTLMSDWPKAGHGLGSGWRVASSFVVDTYAIDQTPTVHSQGDWHNSDTEKLQCTPDSSTASVSYPAILSINPIQAVLTANAVTGVCDPFSDPPFNRPSSLHTTGVLIPLWYVSAQMKLRYDAKRPRQEELTMIVTADTQSILTAPTVNQRSEVMTLHASDVGEPLLQVQAWSDFAGQHVDLAQIIFPNDPTTVGGTSYQICVVAGTAGSVQPIFSDLVGGTTNDGSVVWASMGGTPLLTQPDWTATSDVPLGEIICFSEQVFNPNTSQFETVPNSTSYYICTSPGRTNSIFTTIDYVIPAQTSDQQDSGIQHFTTILRPTFSTTVGAQITDGSVTWTVLGQSPTMLGIPIGGTPENVPARAYFPTDRGLWSVEYLIAVARARLRHRARAVSIKFQVPFRSAAVLSCRKNATIVDNRLPGGTATGKVVAYNLRCHDNGELIGEVHLGVSVGKGGSIEDFEGEGVYASSGYMQNGYQIMEGQITALPGSDINYTRPVFAPSDDGLVFPLTRDQIIIAENINGDADSQADAIRAAIPASQNLANLASPESLPGNQPRGRITFDLSSGSGAWAQEQAARYWTPKSIPAVMEANPVWYELILKPVQNGPFGAEYLIAVSPLKVPQGIDLSAASTP